MSAISSVLLVAVTLVVMLPAAGGAQSLVMYDNFGSGNLSLGSPPDPGRWLTYEQVTVFATRSEVGASGSPNTVENPVRRHPSFSTSNLSAARRIAGGRLQLQLESAGGTNPDPDIVPGRGRIGVIATNRPFFTPPNIIQATVTPMAAEAPGCRESGDSRVRAQLVTMILESWEPFVRKPVFATLSLERSTFGGDRIHAAITRCRDSAGPFTHDVACSVIEETRSVTFTRAWTLGASHTLTIRYEPDSDEPDNSRLVFTVSGGGVATESRVMRRVPADVDGGLGGDFDLRVEAVPAQCPASGDAPAERLAVSMDARFDNVRVRGE
jgi:hypothetical protein